MPSASAAEFLEGDRMLISTSDESLDDDSSNAAVGLSAVAIIDLATQKVLSQSSTAEPLGSLMPVDDNVAVSFFEHPKLFSLRTGTVLKRWETLKSGKQVSSIIWNDVTTPPIASDVSNRRFAVADESSVTVVQIT
jgi:hypothetical protein